MASDPLDRVRGGLYGVAYGDAMGMPGELWARDHIRRHFGRIDGFLPGPDGHFIVDGFVAGQTTDDTQQTVVLATELLEGNGVVDARRFGQRLVEWADRIGASEGNFLGPNSARALQLIRDGAPLEESGARGDTNGSAMRIVPVGLAIPFDELDLLVATVVEACRPTHFTDVGIAGACLIAGAASAAIDAATIDEIVEPALRAAELGRTFGNETLRGSVRRRAELAIGLARDAFDDDGALGALYEVNGAGVETLESVPTALALAVRADGDPVRCARLAANLGGDTDTIGAMSTGICGAFAGLGAFPPDEIAHLDAVNDLPLLTLADGLHRLRQHATG